MAGEWKETSLAAVMDVKHGFAFPGENIRDEPPGDILLTPGNFAIGGGFKGDKFKYFDGEVPKDYVLKEGELVLTMTDLSKQADTLGYPAIVPKPRGPRFLHNQRLGKVLIKRGADLDRGFLFYLLRTAEYRNEVLASATGTTVKHTSPGRILAHKANIPPLAEQKAIAAVLGALDDKIELNRRMNATLEAMARALFQSWFVDFDPVRWNKDEGGRMKDEISALFPDSFQESALGLIPKEWEVVSVGDLATLKGGTQLEKEAFSDRGTIPIFGGAGIMGYGELHNADGFVISVGRVGAYCGQYFYHRGKAWINNNASLIRQREEIPGEWLLLCLRDINMEVIKKGAAQPFVSNSDIAAVKVLLPPHSILDRFQDMIRPVFLTIESNQTQSRTLATLRDTLLPKLLSGELSVSNLQ
jgi:type I restriction enzyme S subunit